MAENVNSTSEIAIDYKAEFEKLQMDYSKLKNSFDKASTDISSYKKQLADKQTDDEKAQAEFQAREERYKALERENSLMKTKAKLSKTISDEKTLDKIANLYADGKYEEAIELTNTYILASRDELKKEIEAELLMKNPTGQAQGASAGITKDEFDKMTYAQKVDLYNKDIDKYNELTKN